MPGIRPKRWRWTVPIGSSERTKQGFTWRNLYGIKPIFLEQKDTPCAFYPDFSH